ncbi:MAG: nucleotide pyrophosphohydrolase [Saprospiraceae bacterium]|nr:nucleotide pyrophosphohydrolase [Saprospiraceae bacterium]
MTIKEWQETTDNWIKTVGVRYFDPMTNTVLAMEELGEFARLMARKYGEQSFKSTEDEAKVDENIKEELGDMFFVLTCLANQMEIDLEAVLNHNIERKTKRDKERHVSNKKLKE